MSKISIFVLFLLSVIDSFLIGFKWPDAFRKSAKQRNVAPLLKQNASGILTKRNDIKDAIRKIVRFARKRKVSQKFTTCLTLHITSNKHT